MVAQRIGSARFDHMHWGGGTPTYLKCEDIQVLFELVQRYFCFTTRSEYAIEIDPRTVDRKKRALLSSLGFSRASLGVQDFDLSVQKKINRVQLLEMVEEVVTDLREYGFRSIIVDLITGLSVQTVRSVKATLNAVIS